MTHCCGVDREFDVTERPLARLDAVDEITVDAARSGVAGNRLRGAFLIRAFHVKVASTRVIVVNKLAVGIAAGCKLLAVFVMEDGEPKLQVVEIGLVDFTSAEILSGLEAGEIVTTGIVETESKQ